MSANAQKYSGKVEFEVSSKADCDAKPIRCCYSYNEEFVHVELYNEIDQRMINLLTVKETGVFYDISGDSIKGISLTTKKEPNGDSPRLFTGAIRQESSKVIDGMQAQLYHSSFGRDSVKIWFTKELDFDAKKYLPAKAFYQDFFVQLLSLGYGFPLEFIAFNYKGEESNFTKVKWTKKKLPETYFNFTKNATIENIEVFDDMESEDFDLLPPPEPVPDIVEKEEIFMVVEQQPEFPGGEKAKIEFFFENLNYPEEALKAGKSGHVVIKFVVRKDGTIDNPQILRDPGLGMGEEALRIVKLMPKWIPGEQRGKSVNVFINLPIRFKLPSK